MRRLSITLFSLCLASALTAQTTGSNQSVRLRADNIDEVVSAMTLEEKVHLVIGCGMSMGSDTKFPGTAGRTYDIPRLGIPSAYLADGPHRLAMAAKREFDSRTYHATEFPSSTTVAATFNPDAAHKVGRTLGMEVKDYGLDVLLAPGVNLMRNVLCGRNHEYYSEDPVLAGKMAAAYINGVQSRGTGTCLKHFAVTSIVAGNDMLQPGQDRQYKAILEAVENGTLDLALLDRSVKRVLEFVVKSHTFAGYEYPNKTDLEAHAQVDREIGAEGIVLLDNKQALPMAAGIKKVALYGTTSYDMVPAGMGFGSTGIGYYTVSMVEGLRNAGYIVDKELLNCYKKHMADEQKRLFPHGKPPFAFTPLPRAEEFLPTAEELAAQVKANDIAVLTLGRVSGEGCDRRVEDFLLKENELALIKQVSAAYRAAGKKLVVVLNICSPVETASWKGLADAVVCAFQPGQEVGNCITDILTGKVNPSGKLPMTFAVKYGDAPSDANFPFDYEFKMPSFAMGTGMNFKSEKKEEKPKEPEKNVDFTNYEEGIYVGYRYFDTFGKEVSYPFGHGLSYTAFDYAVENAKMDADRCELKVSVKNIGKVAGREAVQLYVKAPNGGLDKPAKELKAFGKTALLQPGESQTLILTWNVMDMASFNEKNSSWELAKGEYQWMVAASSADVRCTAVQRVTKARKQKVHDAMRAQVPVAVYPMVKR